MTPATPQQAAPPPASPTSVPVAPTPVAPTPVAPGAPQLAAASPTLPAPTSVPAALTPAATTEPLAMVASANLGYIPILMYHYIRVVDQASDPLGYRLSVAPAVFAQQMDWIAEQGYTPITMATLTDCLRARQVCPPKRVVLTFDDGYEDNALAALPVLQARGFVGTFFIVSSRIGTPGYVRIEQLAALRDAGMEIGAHTVTHADLTSLSLEDAAAEMIESRIMIEQTLGITVRSFSYPAGKYTAEIAQLAHTLGFESAVITQSFRGFDQLYEIPRRRVLGGEPVSGFRYYFVPLAR